MHPLAVLAAQSTQAAQAAQAAQATPATDDARARLLHEGLRLFALQGYNKTSTRELAEAARVNVASISYYFGDKAGLYRAVFTAANGAPEEHRALFDGAGLTLPQALRGFYAGFLEPLKQGDTARLCLKLHIREMLEPTGMWQAEITQGIQPLHDALLALLCRHLGLPAPDTDLHRLAICLAGLGVQMHVCMDVNEHLLPGITQGEAAIDVWADRLVLFGLAMVQAEAQRRGGVVAAGAA